MPKTEAKKVVKKYADVLKKNRVYFSKIYLFGSHALGKGKRSSDIDVALIVNNIKSKRDYLNKKMKLWEIASQVDTRIEPILLEKKDFGKDPTTMAHEVKTKGIRID